MKVNCDGAFNKNGNKKEKCAGIRIVFRNEEGQVITESSKRISVNTCLETEVGALIVAMVLAVKCGFKKIILETDSEIM